MIAFPRLPYSAYFVIRAEEEFKIPLCHQLRLSSLFAVLLLLFPFDAEALFDLVPDHHLRYSGRDHDFFEDIPADPIKFKSPLYAREYSGTIATEGFNMRKFPSHRLDEAYPSFRSEETASCYAPPRPSLWTFSGCSSSCTPIPYHRQSRSSTRSRS